MTIRLNEDGARVYKCWCRDCNNLGGFFTSSSSVKSGKKWHECKECEGETKRDYTESEIDGLFENIKCDVRFAAAKIDMMNENA